MIIDKAIDLVGRTAPVSRRLATLLSALTLPFLVAGCVQSTLDIDARGTQPIPARLTGQMSAKGMQARGPILIRIFKQESELEVWKRDRSGRYALLKTYPMCRWSGQLGPKKKSGDRQAPEGFYHVSASQLNPRSQYHLSFNLGFPNRLEQALGYTGEALMVHGACSSSGCYAVTDDGVSEIYALAREALAGGQQAFQVQAFPFRMTAQKMARVQGNPNYEFWTDLKKGYDLFEMTRTQPKVSYCGKRYVFGAEFEGGNPTDPLAACPPIKTDTPPQVAAKTASDLQAASTLSASAPAFSARYSDGGMHASFRELLQNRGEDSLSKLTSRTKVPVSRPDAALADTYRADRK